MHGYPRVNVEKLHWLICISILEDIWDPIEKVDLYRMYWDDGWWVQVRLGGQQQLALGAHSIKWFRHSLHLLIIVPPQMARTADGEEEMESRMRWVMGGGFLEGAPWEGGGGQKASKENMGQCSR